MLTRQRVRKFYFKFGEEPGFKLLPISKPIKYLILATLSVYIAETVVLIFALLQKLALLNHLPTQWVILVRVISPTITACLIYFLSKKWHIRMSLAFSLLIFLLWMVGFNLFTF